MSQKREESFENSYDVFTDRAPAGSGEYWWRLNDTFDLASAYSEGPANGKIALRWTYTPAIPPKPDENYNGTVFPTLNALDEIFKREDSVVQFQGDFNYAREIMVETFCSQHYYCLFKTLLLPPTSGVEMISVFQRCLSETFNFFYNEDEGLYHQECYINLFQLSSISRTTFTTEGRVYGSCGSEAWQPTQKNWQIQNIDEKLQVALQGGVDRFGRYWENRKKNETFAETVVRQFWNINGNTRTIRNPCEPVLDCTKMGSYTAISLGESNKPLGLPWVLLVSSAVKNINRQLRNQYDELKDAIESLALDTFSIDDFFPKKSQDFALQNSLAGIGGLFSILGGFVPIAGPAIAAAGTIASGVGTFMANSLAASSDPLEAQKVFSQKVLDIYNGSLHAMEDLAEKLFAGEAIPGPGPGNFTILDMMRDDAWVDPKTLSKVSDLNGKLKKEALSRSIDSLWKTRPSNKISYENAADRLVSYTDTTGPPDSKYCADGGVYYTYNFIEQSNRGGGISWLWGADKLEPKAGISLKWVTEASAKSYRLMKEIHQDPFNFNHTLGTAAYLAKAFTAGENNTDPSALVGRSPGSWTLPVCDASTWG
ncbi:MAG: hypothetical protein Q9208_003719 [Pyrenodesmia sp. 3 TL-2023]